MKNSPLLLTEKERKVHPIELSFLFNYLRPDFYRARSINPSKNLWHPPEALGQQDVGHSGVAAGRGDFSQSSLIFSRGLWTPLNCLHALHSSRLL